MRLTPAQDAQPSARELEVFLVLVRTASVKGAAAELGISSSTVKKHMTSLYGRIGAHHRAHAAWLLSRKLRLAERRHRVRRATDA